MYDDEWFEVYVRAPGQVQITAKCPGGGRAAIGYSGKVYVEWFDWPSGAVPLDELEVGAIYRVTNNTVTRVPRPQDEPDTAIRLARELGFLPDIVVRFSPGDETLIKESVISYWHFHYSRYLHTDYSLICRFSTEELNWSGPPLLLKSTDPGENREISFTREAICRWKEGMLVVMCQPFEDNRFPCRLWVCGNPSYGKVAQQVHAAVPYFWQSSPYNPRGPYYRHTA